jgi:hypothetical protein
MPFKIITSKNHDLDKVNNDAKNGKHVFMFLFMNGCGHCETAKPEWDSLQNHGFDDSVNISRINHDLFTNLQNVGPEPVGFPTIRYIKRGKSQEYQGDRTKDAFTNWIKSKIQPLGKSVSINLNKNTYHAKRKTTKHGGRKSRKSKSRKSKSRKSKSRKQSSNTQLYNNMAALGIALTVASNMDTVESNMDDTM